MKPFSKLTELETGQKYKITDEQHNTYTELIEWNTDEEVHYFGSRKLVAHYDDESLYLIKPIENEQISGYLTKIINIEKVE